VLYSITKNKISGGSKMNFFRKLFGKSLEDKVELIKGDGNTITIIVETENLNKYDDFSVIVRNPKTNAEFDFGSYLSQKDIVQEVQTSKCIESINEIPTEVPYDAYFIYVEGIIKGYSEKRIKSCIKKRYPLNSEQSLALKFSYAKNSYNALVGLNPNPVLLKIIKSALNNGNYAVGPKQFYGAILSVHRVMKYLGITDRIVMPS
jgi:hypothetical protein